jgi:hypothetical protein
MDDWATHDYARTYADTIYVPEPTYDAGVSTLEEAGPDTDPLGGTYARAPGRGRLYPAGPGGWWYTPGAPAGPEGAMGPSPRPGPARERPGVREGFYGNIISSRRGFRPVFDVAWDERPLHFNPSAGADWAHLVPDPAARPPGGGPAPSLAFPLIPRGVALNAPKDLFRPDPGGAPAREPAAADRQPGYAVVFLLILLVVLLALVLSSIDRASGRICRHLERLARGRPLG